MDEIVLGTARLVLTPLSGLDEAAHQQASGKSDAAARDTRAAALHWRQHGFGPWAIRDRGDRGVAPVSATLASELIARAAATRFLGAAASNYLWNRTWTFRTSDAPVLGQGGVRRPG